MNHIFDLLREQIKDSTIRHGCPSISCWMKTSKNCDKCELKSLQVREIFEVINEAEAKWDDSKSKAIEILKTEKACVERNIKKQCNRECAKCDLLREDVEILQAYDDAILALGSEAKWESEFCEWHFAKGGYYKTVIASPHKEFISLKTSDLKSQPYCGHCGKRIKIVEVE